MRRGSMRRTWTAGTILVALSCTALPSISSTEAATQAAVSANRIDDVPRIKVYGTTPNVVAGRETELDPTEPTLAVDAQEGMLAPFLQTAHSRINNAIGDAARDSVETEKTVGRDTAKFGFE